MSEITDKYERYFSLEEDFMNYKVDDLLYGYMFYHATPIEESEDKVKFYLRIKKYNTMRKNLKKLLDVDIKTLKRHLDLLMNNGLIWKEMMKINDKDEEVFIFKSDDFIGKYQKVNYTMLEYLIRTSSKQKIKMYIYLLDKYQWKKRENEPPYLFTKRELLGMLGYSQDVSSTSMSYGIVSDNLDSLYREGAIVFEVVKTQEKVDNGKKVVPVERLKLVWMAEALDELRPVPETE